MNKESYNLDDINNIGKDKIKPEAGKLKGHSLAEQIARQKRILTNLDSPLGMHIIIRNLGPAVHIDFGLSPHADIIVESMFRTIETDKRFAAFVGSIAMEWNKRMECNCEDCTIWKANLYKILDGDPNQNLQK